MKLPATLALVYTRSTAPFPPPPVMCLRALYIPVDSQQQQQRQRRRRRYRERERDKLRASAREAVNATTQVTCSRHRDKLSPLRTLYYTPSTYSTVYFHSSSAYTPGAATKKAPTLHTHAVPQVCASYTPSFDPKLIDEVARARGNEKSAEPLERVRTFVCVCI